MLTTDLLIFVLLLTGCVVLTVYKNKLTVAGGICGAFIAVSIYLSASFKGLILLAIFFVLAVMASSFKKAYKKLNGFEEHNDGKRNAWQVLANGGIAALAGLTGFFCYNHLNVFILIIASSLSAATADTISSEMGNIYGRKFYNILSLKPDKRGLDGVVSLEGTLFGLGGSLLIAVVFSIFYGWGISTVIIVVAGTIGNLADSVLGAAFERSSHLNNDIVNFLNTLAGALTALLLSELLS